MTCTWDIDGVGKGVYFIHMVSQEGAKTTPNHQNVTGVNQEEIKKDVFGSIDIREPRISGKSMRLKLQWGALVLFCTLMTANASAIMPNAHEASCAAPSDTLTFPVQVAWGSQSAQDSVVLSSANFPHRADTLVATAAGHSQVDTLNLSFGSSETIRWVNGVTGSNDFAGKGLTAKSILPSHPSYEFASHPLTAMRLAPGGSYSDSSKTFQVPGLAGASYRVMGLNDTTAIGILGDTISSGKRSHMSSLWETFDTENDVYRLSVPLAWPLGQVGETSAMNVANQLSAYVENSSALGSGSVALFDVVRRTADDQAAQSGELDLDVPYQDAMIPIRFNSGSYITDQSPHVYLGDAVPGESVGGAWEPTFASATAGIDRNYDRWTEGAAPNFTSAVLDVEADAFVNVDSITSPTYGAAPGTYRLDWKREVVDEGPWPVPNSNVSCIYPDTEFGGLQSDHNCEITAGDCVSLDYHGYTYNLVQIGDDCWFAEDLRTTVNSAGDTLVLDTDYRYPLDDSTLGPSYGMYYTWYAGMESCPTGWHLASDNEWSAAEVAHGMSESDAYTVTNYRGDIGLKMRDGSTLVHGSSSGPSLTYIGTNDLGMSIVPYGGFYTADGGWYTQSATATAAYYTSTVERDGGNLFIWERWFRNDEDRRKTPARWLWTAPLDGDEMGKIRCVRDGRTAAQRVKLDGSGPCEGVASYTYDGHAYDLVEIGNDCWFAEDLQTTVNAAGDTLVLETDYRYPPILRSLFLRMPCFTRGMSAWSLVLRAGTWLQITNGVQRRLPMACQRITPITEVVTVV